MPRLSRKTPSYRLHKASGQAVVTLNGRDHDLGPYGSEQRHCCDERLVSEWLANHRRLPPQEEQQSPGGMTVG